MQQVKTNSTILLVEELATGRHKLQRHLGEQGYQVMTASSLSQGLALLHGEEISAVIIGYYPDARNWPPPLFDALRETAHADLPVLVVSHSSDQSIFEWVAKRNSTALLAWDDYEQSTGCLGKLLGHQEFMADVPEFNEPNVQARVLFVDDSRTAQVKFRKLLEAQGYSVEVASNAREAMEKARTQSFDIAIIDYFMPNGNGDQLCHMLREDPSTRNITAAVITGTYLEEVIRDTLAAGAVDCMFKNEANELFLARVAAMSRSIQTRKSIETERQRLAQILSSVGDGVYGVDTNGFITFMNPTARHILGLSSAEPVAGRKAHAWFHYVDAHGAANAENNCILQQAYASGKEIHNRQTTFMKKSGEIVPVEYTLLPLGREEHLEGAVVAFRDITERKKLEEELTWQANHDVLTHLYNRRYFEQALESEVARVRRSDDVGALLYIDLDRFKYINDTAGHAAGDQLLVEISRQLKARLRESDLLARLGGDEFAIILKDISSNNIPVAAESFREVLEQYNFAYEGKPYRIYASIGVALINGETPSAGDLLANADIACHVAKNRGRNQVHLYHHQNDEKVVMSMQLGWSERLHKALEQDEFLLLYQPIIPVPNVAMGQLPADDGALWDHYHESGYSGVVHYEVLLRYAHKSGEIVSPNTFLPTAERFGIMPQIDIWVLTRAIQKLAELNSQGHRVTLTVNISGETMDPDRLVETVKALCEKNDLYPGSLVIEITESSAIENIDAAKKLIDELRVVGCRFALDDFGSGFSSFYYLKHLPVDYVKIDGQFVRDMLLDSSDRAIVASINDIAHSFGKQTIAEFVESPETLKLLNQIGVDYAQGYYVASPLTEILDPPAAKAVEL